MRIGFFGNTNNYPFTIAMLLRQMGHTVFFVVTEKLLLHRPESLYPEFEAGYPEWILDLSDLSEWDFMKIGPEMAGALAELSHCDALILNAVGHSLLPFLNKPAIALLTGSDLYNYANFSSIESRTSMWDKAYKDSPEGKSNIAMLRDFIIRQRMGIQTSVAVRYFPKGSLPEDDRLLEELGIPDSKRHFFAISNLNQLEFSPALHNQPLRIFCGARLTWKLPIEIGRSPLDYKGGDVMIRGLGQFHRETGTRFDIHLVRKGLHIKETEELIAEEGITDQVTWHEVLSLVDYWREIENSDIIFDQLADSLPGGPAYDAMAMGRPVIANAREEVSEFPEPSPICQAKTPEEVCAQLKRLVTNPDEREAIGRQGRHYVEKYLNPERSARQIEKILRDALDNPVGQKTSFEVDYVYLLGMLADIRQDAVRDLTMISQQLGQTQQQLEQTKQDLFITRSANERYAKFFKPFRFILNVLRKLPVLNKYIKNLP